MYTDPDTGPTDHGLTKVLPYKEEYTDKTRALSTPSFHDAVFVALELPLCAQGCDRPSHNRLRDIVLASTQIR